MHFVGDILANASIHHYFNHSFLSLCSVGVFPLNEKQI